jgi:hypothetical protein
VRENDFQNACGMLATLALGFMASLALPAYGQHVEILKDIFGSYARQSVSCRQSAQSQKNRFKLESYNANCRSLLDVMDSNPNLKSVVDEALFSNTGLKGQYICKLGVDSKLANETSGSDVQAATNETHIDLVKSLDGQGWVSEVTQVVDCKQMQFSAMSSLPHGSDAYAQLNAPKRGHLIVRYRAGASLGYGQSLPVEFLSLEFYEINAGGFESRVLQRPVQRQ